MGLGKINKDIAEIVEDKTDEELKLLIQTESNERKYDIKVLNDKFDKNFGELESSLAEFNYVAKKFKREKSDMQIMKDTLMGNICKIEEKHENSKIAIRNLALHLGKATEFLTVINHLRKTEALNRSMMHRNSTLNMRHTTYKLPPITSDTSFPQFQISKG